ncbi:nicotinate phosphoribosyltransferase [Azospirillum picis]|uniref:Nicotinate phosphoribosyltransferase n=1 Tax=Azospirillum picis TaxID=488438 RepID=A0ABU0MJM8_9PROT|nr:nicotinate phosphoribosyltransferase [Azospirillum picis]MBP2299864.1 nicotinate phosphoribosyltransferase [Azospirillum picis]MDQ0533660.1 nicotinate phosphoribosyltransferase [Azospirillum picis]
MLVNFSSRAHNHNFATDFIVRSLLDTDWYKLAMLQFIWRHFRDVKVRFSLINRTRSVKLARIIDEAELRRQLDNVRSLRLKRSEAVWLQGNTFYGQRGIFRPEFVAWLADDFALPDYRLSEEDGQWRLDFEGSWAMTTMWEIYALSIINELKTRAALANMTETELDILYARAKVRLWDKIERLRPVADLSLSDFGTRRRHSFLWQEYVVETMAAELGPRFIGTSNTHLAMKHDLEAIGTNAHELPTTVAALARTEDELLGAQYEVLRLWQETYGGAMLVFLPDTFGSTQFLKNAPDWVGEWTGMRVDSKEPVTAGEEYIAWLERHGRDPREKRVLFSDGLDVEDILRLHQAFGGRIRDGYGWGTLLTSDFRNCHPRSNQGLDPLSLVCKVTAVEVDGVWKGAVKLSDNYEKATGPAAEVARYRAIFGTEGVANVPVLV